MSKNNAFTLAEILMVVTVIGVISVLSFNFYKNHEEKALARSYAKAYQTLRLAAFNLQNEVTEYNRKKNEAALENGNAGAPDSELLKFPGVAANQADTASAETFATKMMSYINGRTTSNPTPAGLGNIAAKYTISDGMIYYFASDIISGTAGSSTNDFYVVWVDLNGPRIPNTTVSTSKKNADIVPFLIDSTYGEVVPTGYPAYNGTYVIARVLYSSPDTTKPYSSVMTFAQAQKAAYNNVSYARDPYSQTASVNSFDSTLPEGYTKDTTAPSGSYDTVACRTAGNPNADFPPCKVEVNVQF